jgi:PAS domain S-box-containing protein
MNADSLNIFFKNDLLHNILRYSDDFGACATHVTSQLREMVAVRLVALFERRPDGSFVMAGISPERRGSIFERDEALELIKLAALAPTPLWIRPGEGELGLSLAALGQGDSFVIPLHSHDEVQGVLLLLDMMETRGAAALLEAFHSISGLLALIMRNSFLYRHLEERVAERTRELLESSQFNRQIIESVNEGIIVHGPDLRYQVWNPFMERHSGLKAADVIGRHPREVFPDFSTEGLLERLKASLKGEIPEPKEIPLTAGGQTRWILDTCAPLLSVDGRIMGVITTVQDITERKKAEAERERLTEQLVAAQKLESVGRLAGGVAHDFNNMLSVILGHVELAQDGIEAGRPHQEDLEEIRKAAQRSADLTKQLLAFARKQTVAPVVLDLNEKITGMVKMLERLIGEDVDLLWLPGSKLWPVRMDPSQIDQVLTNLCVNARDAIPGVGRVTIESANLVIDDAHCGCQEGCLPGEYVRISVRDSGSGIAKAVLPHLFEPFFTTKAQGKGTGLGLATVFGIVKQNKGFIQVDSELGAGSTFSVYLPRHVSLEPQVLKETEKGKPSGGHGTILLVEDEPAILKMVTLMLEHLGYHVLRAGTALEALRTVEGYGEVIHLLMTDVVMPQMNGRDLFLALRTRRPDLRCLFMSGYTADVIAHHGVLDEGLAFIQKPFSMKDLDDKINRALETE